MLGHLLFLFIFAFYAPSAPADDACSITSLKNTELVAKFEAASDVNKRAIIREIRRICGENPTADCTESRMSELFRDYNGRQFYSVHSAYVGEENGKVVTNGRITAKYNTTYFKTEAERAPYLGEVKNGKILSQKTGEPFGAWDPAVGPKSENYAKLLKENGIGPEQAIFVIDRNERLLINPEKQVGVFHHSTFMGGEPVLAPGRIDMTPDGKVTRIDSFSGHYTAGQEMLDFTIEYFRKRGVTLKETSRSYNAKEKCWYAFFE